MPSTHDPIAHAGDGFTPEELGPSPSLPVLPTASMLPAWNPKNEYPRTLIADLGFGPGCVTITGRIIALANRGGVSSETGPVVVKGSDGKAKGYWKMFVADGSGICCVGFCSHTLHSTLSLSPCCISQQVRN